MTFRFGSFLDENMVIVEFNSQVTSFVSWCFCISRRLSHKVISWISVHSQVPRRPQGRPNLGDQQTAQALLQGSAAGLWTAAHLQILEAQNTALVVSIGCFYVKSRFHPNFGCFNCFLKILIWEEKTEKINVKVAWSKATQRTSSTAAFSSSTSSSTCINEGRDVNHLL